MYSEVNNFQITLCGGNSKTIFLKDFVIQKTTFFRNKMTFKLLEKL